MNTLDAYLKIDTCPHCSVDFPNMSCKHMFDTQFDNGEEPKLWGAYACKRCGGAVLAQANPVSKLVEKVFPEIETANQSLPSTVKHYLDEAMRCVSSPSASIMVSNSAVDAMLKEKGYEEGSLYSRIKKAREDNVLTLDMETWAHQVRLDSNDQRHADRNAIFPSLADAKVCLEFAKTLGEILFVLPAKVKRGLLNSGPIYKKEKQSAKPKALNLPTAFRNGPYSQQIKLGKIDTKPIVVAKLYSTLGGRLLSSELQPSELEVSKRPGYKDHWIAEFRVEKCSGLPELLYVQIFVNDQVNYAGSLTISGKL